MGKVSAYKSYETWVDGYFAKKLILSQFIGSSISLKSSNFHNVSTKNLSTSFGLIKNLKIKIIQLGFQ